MSLNVPYAITRVTVCLLPQTICSMGAEATTVLLTTKFLGPGSVSGEWWIRYSINIAEWMDGQVDGWVNEQLDG